MDYDHTLIKDECAGCGDLCDKLDEDREARYEVRGNWCRHCIEKANRNYRKRLAENNLEYYRL